MLLMQTSWAGKTALPRRACPSLPEQDFVDVDICLGSCCSCWNSVLSRPAAQRVVARLFEQFVGFAGDLGLEDLLDPIARKHILDCDRHGFVAAFQDGGDVLG